MYRFIQSFWSSIGHRLAQAGRWQHAKTAGQHRGGIRQQIAKQIVGYDHIKLFGPAAELHRTRIGIHMAKLHIGIILVVHLLHHFAPQHAGFHHVGFFHRTNLVRPTPG